MRAAVEAPKVSCSDVCRLVWLVLLLPPCNFLLNLSAFEVFTTEEAAQRMFRENSNHALPAALQGVLWMAGNPAPELLMTLEAGQVDTALRTVTLACGERYGWSYNRDRLGFIEYFFVTLSWTLLRAGTLEFQFDEDWRSALLFEKVYGKTVQQWYFEQAEESDQTFVRGHIDGDGQKRPRYTALKVIDHAGRKLPAFDRMVAAGRNGTLVRDIPEIRFIDDGLARRPKTYIQLEHSRPGVLTFLVAILLLFDYCMCCLQCFLKSDYRSESRASHWTALQAPPPLPGPHGQVLFASL